MRGDLELEAAARRVRLLKLLRPLNEPAARQAFLAGTSAEPQLDYPREPHDHGALARRLEKLRFASGPVGELLETKREHLLLLSRAMETRAVREATRKVYGTPGCELVSAARKVLSELEPLRRPPVEPVSVVSRALRGALEKHGLEGWRVVDSPGDFTAVRTLERTISVTPVGPVVRGTGARLAVHEVEVHVLRAVNGSHQPLRLFAHGLPGYEATEEGLAAYAELASGTANREVLRKYAARVLAVDSMSRGATFRESFERLLEAGLTEAQAWAAALRAHRGGGCFKDHIYLEGLLEVVRHIEAGGRLEGLFVGKVGLSHLALVEQWLAEGWLRPARHLPRWEGGDTVLLDFIRTLASR